MTAIASSQSAPDHPHVVEADSLQDFRAPPGQRRERRHLGTCDDRTGFTATSPTEMSSVRSLQEQEIVSQITASALRPMIDFTSTIGCLTGSASR